VCLFDKMLKLFTKKFKYSFSLIALFLIIGAIYAPKSFALSDPAQRFEISSKNARGACQYLGTGLTGTIGTVGLKVKFNQAGSDFYPPNGNNGTNGIDLMSASSDLGCGDPGLVAVSGFRNGTITNYSSSNTATYQSIYYTPNVSPTFNSSTHYYLMVVMNNSGQTFDIKTSGAFNYYGQRAKFINPFTPYALDSGQHELYFSFSSISNFGFVYPTDGFCYFVNSVF